MAFTVFPIGEQNHQTQTMFLGDPISVSRNDNPKFKIFDTFVDKQMAFFWKPEEVKLTDERKQFKELSEAEKHIFLNNIKYQILLDSVQGRAPNLTFLEIASLPEIESWVSTWSFFEIIHSRSYTYILKNLFPDPSKVLDEITLDEEIINRALSISKHYDKLKELIIKHQTGELKDINELKKQLYFTLISVNALEGIRFYVSFACSFAFAESKRVMEGNAKIIKFIARDEVLHLHATQHMLNLIHRGRDDLFLCEFSKTDECRNEVYKIYKELVDQEKAWSSFLFKNGSMLGLNEMMLNKYLEHLCNVRLKAIEYDPIFEKTSDELPWMSKWLSNNDQQEAPQETEKTGYTISQINNDDVDINIDL